MHVIFDLVHILNSQARYSGAQWDYFASILTDKEFEVVETVRSNQPIPKYFSSAQRHKLIAKLCRQVAHYTPAATRCSEYQEKLLLCESYIYTFRVLTILKRFSSAIDLSVKILALCKSLDLTLPRIEVLRFLVRHYLPSGRKEYFKYATQLTRYQHVYSAESKAEGCYNSLCLLPRDSVENRKRLSTRAIEYLFLLQGFIDKKVVSNDFYLSYYRIQTLAEYLKGDYHQAIRTLLLAIEFYERQPTVYNKAVTILRTELINNYLQINQLKEARLLLDKLLDSDIDSVDYIKAQRLFIRLNLMQKEYRLGYSAYNQLIASQQYKSLPPSDGHIEVIIKQYFNVLILMGKIPSEKIPSRLLINRFLKKEPGVNYLKKEIRIQLIIVQLLFNIFYREYDEMEIRLDTLKDYCARRLSVKSPFLRSNIFIRMLLVVPTCRFNSIRSERHGLSLYKRLLASSQEMKMNDRALEIVPYEHLWELVLECLLQPAKKRSVLGFSHT